MQFEEIRSVNLRSLILTSDMCELFGRVDDKKVKSRQVCSVQDIFREVCATLDEKITN